MHKLVAGLFLAAISAWAQSSPRTQLMLPDTVIQGGPHPGSIILPPATTTEPTGRAALRRAEQRLDANDPKGAAEAARGLEPQTGSPEAAFVLARVRLTIPDAPGAVKAAEAGLAGAPAKWVRLYRTEFIDVCALAAAEPTVAIRALDESLKKAPGDRSEVLLTLAEAYARMGDWEHAARSVAGPGEVSGGFRVRTRLLQARLQKLAGQPESAAKFFVDALAAAEPLRREEVQTLVRSAADSWETELKVTRDPATAAAVKLLLAAQFPLDASHSEAQRSRIASIDKLIKGKESGARNLVRGPLEEQTELFRGCYDRALPQNPKLEGAVAVKLAISPDGAVQVDATAKEEPMRGVATCIANRLKAMRFTAASGIDVSSAWLFKLF